MKSIISDGCEFSFPENEAEYINWSPDKSRYILHRNVMCFAHTRVEGKWSAYCFPVPGINHDDEEYLWENEGDKLPKNVADMLFPQFAGLPYAK